MYWNTAVKYIDELLELSMSILCHFILSLQYSTVSNISLFTLDLSDISVTSENLDL